ncbi:MAG: hypothetical protein QM602_00240, partial [Microbacterium sp.]
MEVDDTLFRYAVRVTPAFALITPLPLATENCDAVPLSVQAPPVVAEPHPLLTVRSNSSAAST